MAFGKCLVFLVVVVAFLAYIPLCERACFFFAAARRLCGFGFGVLGLIGGVITAWVLFCI